MDTQPWILISIAVVILLLLGVVVLLRRKAKRPPDYYAIFTIGSVWFVLGIPLRNWMMSGLGAIFVIVGLINRDKWKTNRQTWDKLNEDEKRWRIIVMIILGALILLGLVAFWFQSQAI